MSALRKPAGSERASLYMSRYSWEAETLAVRTLICRGKYQYALLDLIRHRTEGRKRGDKTVIPEWSGRIVYSTIAKEWGCSAQSLRDESRDAVKRGLWESREDGEGGVNLRPCFENWDRLAAEERARLKDNGLKLVKSESDDEPASDDPARPASAPVRLKPVTVRAGAPSKPLKIETGVKSIGFRVDGPGEYKTETVISGGHIDVSVVLTPNGFNQIRQKDAPISAPTPISAFPGGVKVPTSGDLLADLIRVQTGLVVDGPGCRRIEKALNGSIPLPFYLEELAAAVQDVRHPKPGLAINLAEQKIRDRWRLRKADFEAAQAEVERKHQSRAGSCPDCGRKWDDGCLCHLPPDKRKLHATTA